MIGTVTRAEPSIGRGIHLVSIDDRYARSVSRLPRYSGARRSTEGWYCRQNYYWSMPVPWTIRSVVENMVRLEGVPRP